MGFDLVGVIAPLSLEGHKWIIIATNYFTKWVEVILLITSMGVDQVTKFILYQIICHFGILATIFTNHGANFENLNMEELCTSLYIHHHFSSPYFPKDNDQVKATNKTILKILKEVLSDFGHDWHLQIKPALWAYHTLFHTSTGTNPYCLVYGAKVALPIEVELLFLGISLWDQISFEDCRVARLTKLDLLDEKR